MSSTFVRAVRMPLTWIVLLVLAMAILVAFEQSGSAASGGSAPSTTTTTTGTTSGASTSKVKPPKPPDPCADVPKDQKKECKASKG